MDRAAEHGVSSEKTGEEGVVMSLFTVRGGVAEEEHRALVDEREEAEVAGMLARGFEDEPAFRAESV